MLKMWHDAKWCYTTYKSTNLACSPYWLSFWSHSNSDSCSSSGNESEFLQSFQSSNPAICTRSLRTRTGVAAVVFICFPFLRPLFHAVHDSQESSDAAYIPAMPFWYCGGSDGSGLLKGQCAQNCKSSSSLMFEFRQSRVLAYLQTEEGVPSGLRTKEVRLYQKRNGGWPQGKVSTENFRVESWATRHLARQRLVWSHAGILHPRSETWIES